MDTLLLGMNNPHHDDPEYDLWPGPKNCTGWRIWQMLYSRTGATQSDYIRAFHRRNLVRGRTWDKSKIGNSVTQLSPLMNPGTTVVLLGDLVLSAVNDLFRVKKILIHPQEVQGITYRFVPHPSGRNLFYNDPVQKELVAMLLEDLYRESNYAKTKEATTRSSTEV